MNIKRHTTVLLAGLLAGAAWGQTPVRPLNLKLPPGDMPSSSASAATAPAGSATVTGNMPALPAPGAADAASTSDAARPAPGKYYGDTSGRIADVADTPACDDSTYNKAQVHGSVSTGIFSGSHVGTGTYEGGNVNVTKRLGSCDDPRGGVNMSISVGASHLNGRGYRGNDH